MKKTILTLAGAALMATVIFSGCQSSAKKVENAQDQLKEAQDNVVIANQDLNKAVNDSIALFKKDAEAKIKANEQSIAEFKIRIANEKQATKAKYEKKVAEIEQQNSDLKKKLDDYKADGLDKWQAFKLEFGKDMNELGTALKDFTVKSKK
jgi:hypothetical protein